LWSGRRSQRIAARWSHAGSVTAQKAVIQMHTLAHAAYLDSSFGAISELPHAGSPLENPFVYDDAAREIKQLAARGLVEIVSEHKVQRADEELIDHLSFKRLR
jgi:hypothetical protein